MTLVVAHGQPKSGSTFAYFAALKIADHVNGTPFEEFGRELLGDEFRAFIHEVPKDALIEIEQKLGDGQMFVIKSHGPMGDGIADLISEGRVKAFTTFRDPRDTALAILDVAAKERREGIERWFTQFTELEQLTRAIRSHVRHVKAWVDHPNVLSIPYYMIAASPRSCLTLLANHLDHGEIGDRVASEMIAGRGEIPEFNKGVPDRFIEGLSPEDLRLAGDIWEQALETYESMLVEKMTEHGFGALYRELVDARDRRLAEVLTD